MGEMTDKVRFLNKMIEYGKELLDKELNSVPEPPPVPREQKYIFELDGRVTPEGQDLSLQIEHFLKDIFEKCNERRLPPRELANLIHSATSLTESRAILEGRRLGFIKEKR